MIRWSPLWLLNRLFVMMYGWNMRLNNRNQITCGHIIFDSVTVGKKTCLENVYTKRTLEHEWLHKSPMYCSKSIKCVIFFFLRKWMHIHYIQDNVRSFNVVDLPTLLLPSSLSLQTNYTQKTLLSDEPFRKNLEDINIRDVFIQLNTDWCTQKRLYFVAIKTKFFFCVRV